MAKTKRKNKSRVSQAHKAVERATRGFWMKFDLVDPLADRNQLVNAKVGSRNPVIAVQLNNERFWRLLTGVIDIKKLKWRMEIKMEFTRKDGGSEFKAFEMVAFAALPELNDVYEETIEAMFKEAQDKNYINRYVRTYVTQEVLGGHEIRDEDFSEAS